MKMQSRVVAFYTSVVLALAAYSTPNSAQAYAFIYQFGDVFEGTAPESPDRPWVTAEFADVTPGEVRLTVTATALTGNENLESLYLNLNPADNSTRLHFDLLSTSG